MSDRQEPTLREILGAIKSVINGEPVSPDFKRKQNDGATALPGKFLRRVFSIRTLVFIVLMALVIAPAVRKFMSN